MHDDVRFFGELVEPATNSESAVLGMRVGRAGGR